MKEVIELLSSSPPKPAGFASSQVVPKTSLNFDLDEINTDDDNNVSIQQPAKRRRLSPDGSQRDKHRGNPTETLDRVFEFSSEYDLPTYNARQDSTLPAKPSASSRSRKVAHTSNLFHFSSSSPGFKHKPPEDGPVVLELSSEGDIELNTTNAVSNPSSELSDLVFAERSVNTVHNTLASSIRTTTIPTTTTITTTTAKATAKMTFDAKAQNLDISLARATTISTHDETNGRYKQTLVQPTEDISSSPQLEPKPIVKKAVKITDHHKQSKSSSINVMTEPKVCRDAEKQAEKERKRRAKELKQQEKQEATELAVANKSKTNKKVSTSEMILDVSGSLCQTALGSHIEDFMTELGVEIRYRGEEEVDLSCGYGVGTGRLIRWRRKVTADYDESHEIWKPLASPRITTEAHILLYFKAEEFLTLAVVGKTLDTASALEITMASMKSHLDTYMAELRQKYPQCRLVLLLEGLTAFLRRSDNAKNRAYTAAVRSLKEPTDQAASSTQSNKRRKKPVSKPDLDLSSVTQQQAELLLLHLQVQHQPLTIQHTTSTATSASQISVLTQHLSTRPYRLAAQSANLNSASFCMTTGQIKTGSTPHETWINMLQEINRVTPSMAYGISAAGHRSAADLVRAFRQREAVDVASGGGVAGAKLLLEDVRKSVNKDGGWSDRRLGPMVSKRIWKVFMSTDPGMRDGIA